MRKGLLALIFFGIAITSTSFAGGIIEFSFAPELGINDGDTDYSLRVSDFSGDTTIASELVFPLDMTVGGASFQINNALDKTMWSVKFSFLTALSDPSDKMTDSDWLAILPYFGETLFSYTESDVKMSMYQLDLDATYRLINTDKFDISIAGGIRYQKIEQDIVGFEGFQLQRITDSTFSDPIMFAFDDPALYYEIKITQPKIGTHIDYDPVQKLSFDVTALFAPVFFENLDDHLLRKKRSIADGDGSGFIGRLAAEYSFAGNANLKPFLQLSGEINTYEANGSQTQTWYEEVEEYDMFSGEPVTIPAGTSISGIPHKVKGTQYRIGFSVGTRF